MQHMQRFSFSKKNKIFLKLASFILTNDDIYTKLPTFSKSSVKTKVRSAWTFSVIFSTSVVISIQRPFHRSKIVKYFQN